MNSTYVELKMCYSGDNFTLTFHYFSPVVCHEQVELYRTPTFAYQDLRDFIRSGIPFIFADFETVKALLHLCEIARKSYNWEIDRFLSELIWKISEREKVSM